MNTVLSIAGSDPSAGAGTQADIRTILAMDCHPLSVITALTVQNTQGVRHVEPVSPMLLRQQLETLLADIRPDAIKIGMLGKAEFLPILTEIFHKFDLQNVVWDPVMYSSSGFPLMEDVSPLDLQSFLERVTIVTPNLSEFSAWFGEMDSENSEIPSSFHQWTPNFVGLTGGHREGEKIRNYLFDIDGEIYDYNEFERIETTNDHGTGCMFSSALAAFLARGNEMNNAFHLASEFVHTSLMESKHLKIGKGRGIIKATTTLWTSLS